MSTALTADHLSVIGPPHYRRYPELRRKLTPPVRAGLTAGVCWLPLLLLTAGDDLLQRSFAFDLALHVRLLISIPVFILIEGLIASRLDPAARHFRVSGLVADASLPALAAIEARIERLRDAPVVPILLALTALALGPVTRMISVTEIGIDLPLWRRTAAPEAWFLLVAGPIFRFLLLRWLFWMGLWGLFQFEVSRLELRLRSTHPDCRGGLAFLGASLTSFAWLSFAIAAPVAAQARMLWGPPVGQALPSYLFPLALVAGVCVVLLFVPLFAFSSKLRTAKRRGVVEFSALALTQARQFQDRWFGYRKEGDALVAENFSAVTDLGSTFERTQKLEWVPFTLRPVLVVAGGAFWAAVPMLLIDRDFLEVALKVMHALG